MRVIGSAYGGFLGGSRGARILGGEIGSIDPNDGLHMNAADGQNYDTVVDGLYMHDLTRNQDPAAHTDCVQVGSAVGLVIRNSRFVNCATQGIFVSQYGAGTTSDVTLENNWLGSAQLGYYALYVGLATRVAVRNNSVAGSGAYIDTRESATTMVGNIFAATEPYGCATLAQRAVRFAYNVTAGGCSGAGNHLSDPGVAEGFVNSSAAASAAFDLHLRAGAKAIDRGDPSAFPVHDFDGDSRPQGSGPDAGADEFGVPSDPVGDRPIPSQPDVTPSEKVRTLIGDKLERVRGVDRLPGVQVFASARPLPLRATAAPQKVLAVVSERTGTLKVTQRIVFGRHGVRLRTRSLRLHAGIAQAINVRLTASARKRFRTRRSARIDLGFTFRRAADRVSLRVRRP